MIEENVIFKTADFYVEKNASIQSEFLIFENPEKFSVRFLSGLKIKSLFCVFPLGLRLGTMLLSFP